jgi:hypothetical protein
MFPSLPVKVAFLRKYFRKVHKLDDARLFALPSCSNGSKLGCPMAPPVPLTLPTVAAF